jgi:hypothetical protein
MTHCTLQAAVEAYAARADLDDLPMLYSTGELSDSIQAVEKGVLAVLAMHAPSSCETRSTSLNMDRAETFCVFYPVNYPRQLYRQHLRHKLEQ